MKLHLILFFLSTLLFHINGSTQSSSSHTTFGKDYIEINYKQNGKEGVIKARHGIPLNNLPITEAATDKKAKDENDTLKISSLNYYLLDSLIWVECNKYRKVKSLPAIAWNDTIYWASKNHSVYQAYFNVVSHGEKNSIPGRSKEQLHYKKIHAFSAEICMVNSFTDGETNYNELAIEIIKQWKRSPGHNAIMISSAYKLNSFSAAFRYDNLSLLTRENMLLYNPELLIRIESVLPDYFERTIDYSNINVWCTGNFVEIDNLKNKLAR